MAAKNKLSGFEKVLAVILGSLFAVFLLTYIFDLLTWSTSWVIAGLLAVGAICVFGAWVGLKELRARKFLSLEPGKRRQYLTFLIAVLAAVILLSTIFPAPVFLTTHTLQICAPSSSEGFPFTITRVRLQDGTVVGLSTIKGSAPWNLEVDGLSTLSPGTCAVYSAFFAGGAQADLRSRPGMGAAEITWDGKKTTVDLASVDESQVRVDLPGSSIGQPSALRGMVANLAFAGLISSLLAFSALAALWLTKSKSLLGEDGWLYKVLGLVAGWSLVTIGQIGKSTALVADDFCSIADVQGSGVLGSTWNYYTGVNGRIGASFLDAANASVFQTESFKWAPLLLCLLWLGLFFYLYKNLLERVFKPIGNSKLLLLASITLLTMLFSSQAFLQTIFWSSGRTPVVTPLVIMTLLLGMIARSTKPRPRFFSVLAIFLLSLAAALFHEAYSAAATTLWTLVLGSILLQSKRQRANIVPILSASLLGTLIGFFVNLLSPGTAERSSALGTTHILGDMVVGAFTNTNQFFFFQMLSISTLALFGIAFFAGATWKSSLTKKSLFQIWWLLPVFTYVVVLASYAVSQYGLGGGLPERTQLIPIFWFTLFATLWGLVTGQIVGALARTVEEKKMAQLVNAFAVIALAASFLSSSVFLINAYPKLARYQNAVAVFWRQVEDARTAGLDRVVVDRLPLNPYGVVDPTENESTFVDTCIDSATDVDVRFR